MHRPTLLEYIVSSKVAILLLDLTFSVAELPFLGFELVWLFRTG